MLSQWLYRWVTTQYRSDQSNDVKWHLLLSIRMLSQWLCRWVTKQYRSDQSPDVRWHQLLSIRALSQWLCRWVTRQYLHRRAVSFPSGDKHSVPSGPLPSAEGSVSVWVRKVTWWQLLTWWQFKCLHSLTPFLNTHTHAQYRRDYIFTHTLSIYLHTHTLDSIYTQALFLLDCWYTSSISLSLHTHTHTHVHKQTSAQYQHLIDSFSRFIINIDDDRISSIHN